MDWKDKFCNLLFPLNASDRNEAEAEKLKYVNRPKLVFKYRGVDPERFPKYLDQIEKNAIWLSRPDSFNDPYDCYFVGSFQITFFEYVLKALPEFANAPGVDLDACRNSPEPAKMLFQMVLLSAGNFTQENLKAIEDQFSRQSFKEQREDLNNTIRICCFSERNDSILMWSHYSDDHKGFCLSYDLEQSTEASFRNLYPVIYRTEIADVTAELTKRFKGWGGKPSIFKSLEWSYEQEWRQLQVIPDKSHPGALMNFHPIRGLYLGKAISPENKAVLTALAQTKRIPVYQMSMSEKEFKLVATPI